MKPFLLALVACSFVATATLQADPAKDAALEKYLKLTHAEEGFKVGAKAGMKAGFDPKNNPSLSMIPPAKLEKMKVALSKLFETDFTFASIKPALKKSLGELYTIEELNELNSMLEKPIMQKFFKTQTEMIPITMKLSQEAVKPLQPKIMAVTQKIMLER